MFVLFSSLLIVIEVTQFDQKSRIAIYYITARYSSCGRGLKLSWHRILDRYLIYWWQYRLHSNISCSVRNRIGIHNWSSWIVIDQDYELNCAMCCIKFRTCPVVILKQFSMPALASDPEHRHAIKLVHFFTLPTL